MCACVSLHLRAKDYCAKYIPSPNLFNDTMQLFYLRTLTLKYHYYSTITAPAFFFLHLFSVLLCLPEIQLSGKIFFFFYSYCKSQSVNENFADGSTGG